MDPQLIENYLSKLRNQIYVDQSLKEQLRKKYIRKRRKKIFHRSLFSGLIAAVLCLVFFSGMNQSNQVNAQALAITNAISFLDIESGEISSFTHHDGQLYIAIKNKGIYKHSDNGLAFVTKIAPDSFEFSSNGEQLIYEVNGSISILNVRTMSQQHLLEKNTQVYYSDPTWKDKQHVYITKQNGEESLIIEYNLETKKEKVVTAGTQPTFVEKEQKLIFEHNGMIMVKDLNNGKEQVIDEGKDPAVSVDGLYIAYVKETAHIEDVWITDLDVKTKKKVTANPASKPTSDRGLYTYTTPVWHSAKPELYVVKAKEEQPAKIMKITLSSEEISASETVEQYFQALIKRDDDYAKSMMAQPPEFLTYSNPHQIGYQILSSEKKDDLVHVTAESYWITTATPFYQVSTYEFILYKEENHFMIKDIHELSRKQIIGTDTNEIQVTDGKESITLFSFEDIPNEYKTHENIRFSSIIENPLTNTIIFSLQEYETAGAASEVSLISYDQQTKTFTLLSRLEATEGLDVVLEHMSLDSTGQFLAVDTFMDIAYPVLLIFDLNTGTEIDRFKWASSLTWKNDQLLMTIKDEQQSLLYQFTPKTRQLTAF